MLSTQIRSASTVFLFFVNFCFAALSTSALAQGELYHVEGTTPGSNFGFRLAAVGDVDLDGIADFLVGAPADSTALSYAGRASLHSGADGRVVHEWFGAAPLEFLGSAVAGAGDVDQDAIPDLFVGVLREVDPSSGRATGSARLYSGVDGSLIRVFYGSYDKEDFGAAVANLGDVDGDGIDDQLVGAPGADFKNVDGGAAYLYSGGTGQFLGRVDSAGKNNMLGSAVAALGDVDGDGRGDFAVGLPGRDGNALHDSGVVWVFSGAGPKFLFEIAGDQAGLELGLAIAGGHDLDGDGTPDLLLGEPQRSGTLSAQGAVRARSGVDGALIWERWGTRVDDHLGVAVAMADADGDGRPELLVSAGSSSDLQQRVELAIADGTRLHGWANVQIGDGLGASLAFLGDVDGDRLADFAFGSPHSDDGNYTYAGFVRVLPGARLWLDAEPKEGGAGATLVTTIRVGVPGALALRFVVDVSGTPLFLALPPIATFDASGSVVDVETIPPGLAGLTVTLRAYAIGASGRLVATNDETIALL